MSDFIKVLGDIKLSGSLSYATNFADFPDNPDPRTIIVKEGMPYIYTELKNGSGYYTWMPLGVKHANFLHTQGVPSLIWTIPHGFGTTNFAYFVYDNQHNMLFANIRHIDNNTSQILLSSASSGTAVLFALGEIVAPVVSVTTGLKLGALDLTEGANGRLNVNMEPVALLTDIANIVAGQIDGSTLGATITDILASKADQASTYTKTETDALVGGVQAMIPNVSGFITATDVATKADQLTTYTKTEVDTLITGAEAMIPDVSGFALSTDLVSGLSLKADQDTTYNKTEVDTLITGVESLIPSVAGLATTVYVDGGLGLKANIGDSYTKAESDAMVNGAIALIPSTDSFVGVTALTDGLALKANISDTYTKSETDTAIAAVAAAIPDTTDLANAATVEAALGEKADKIDTATKLELSTQIGQVTALIPSLDGLVTSTELTTGLATKADATLLALKADQVTTYTKTEVDGKFNTIAGVSPDLVATIDSLKAYMISDTSGASSLTTTLAGKADKTELAGYVTTSAFTAVMDAKVSTTALADYVTNGALSTALTSKADSSHVHTIANVTGLQSALDALNSKNSAATWNATTKVATTGLMPAADKKYLEDTIKPAMSIASTSAMRNGLLGWQDKQKYDNASQYAVANVNGGIITGADQAKIDSIPSTGVKTYVAATTTANGLMSSTDKTKLDGLQTYSVLTALGGSTAATLVTRNDKYVWNNLSSNVVLKTQYAIAGSTDGIITAADQAKIDSIPSSGVKTYSNVVSNSATSGLMTGSDKAKLDGLQTYTAVTALSGSTSAGLTTRGDKFILDRLNTNAVLKTQFAVANTTDGIISAADQAKIDSIPAGGVKVYTAVVAGSTTAGLMTGGDKTKLDGLTAYTVATASSGSATVGLTTRGDKYTLDFLNSNAVLKSQLANDVTNTSGIISGADYAKIKSIPMTGVPIYTNVVSGSATSGLMTGTDKAKLDTLQAYAVATTTVSGLLSATDKVKLNNLQSYSAVTTTADGLMSSVDKVKLNGLTSYSNVVAGSTTAGLMTGSDKTKLDGIEAGAQKNTISSVNGKTGVVLIGTADIDGLDAALAAAGNSSGSLTQDFNAQTLTVAGNIVPSVNNISTIGSSSAQFASAYVNSVYAGSLTVSGNLTVTGTTVTVNSTDVSIKDNIIRLNKGETGAGVSLGTAGIEIDRGTGALQRLVWSETAGKWVAGLAGSEVALATEAFVTSSIAATSSYTKAETYTKAEVDAAIAAAIAAFKATMYVA